MADETNWEAYGLMEEALESALVSHRLPWEEVRAAALKAIAFIDERMASVEDAEATVEAMASYVPQVRFLTPPGNIIELSGRQPGVPEQS